MMTGESKRSEDGILRMGRGKQAANALYLLLAFLVLGLSLWPAVSMYWFFSPAVEGPVHSVVLILGCFLVFNYAYLFVLLGLRFLIPKPREGYFPVRPGNRPPPESIILIFNLILSKLRYIPPWVSFFSSGLVRIPPMDGLYRRIFGPYTVSMTFGDIVQTLDPYLLYAGRDVQFGYGSIILGHLFDNRGLLIKRVTIEDFAVVGGETTIYPGVHIGHHAVVMANSKVFPNTVIKPYELWGGNPAKKIKDIPHDAEEPGESEKPAMEAVARNVS